MSLSNKIARLENDLNEVDWIQDGINAILNNEIDYESLVEACEKLGYAPKIADDLFAKAGVPIPELSGMRRI